MQPLRRVVLFVCLALCFAAAAEAAPTTFTIGGGSVTTSDLSAWGGISRTTFAPKLDLSAGPVEIIMSGFDVSDIWYEGRWPWPPLPESLGAFAGFGISGTGVWSQHQISSGIGNGGGSWDQQAATWNHNDGFRKYLIQNSWSGLPVGQVVGSHQFNVEAIKVRGGPGATPNDPAQADRECNTFDLKVTYTPNGDGTYAVSGQVRLHKAASWEEMAAWGPYRWAWNKAINSVGAEAAWCPFYDGSWSVGGSGFTAVSPYVQIQNWGVPQTRSHSVRWQSLTITGTLSGSPDVVWVDDDWTGAGDCGGHIWGYDAFATIEAATTAVASGGTVNVAAGAYPESVTVAQSLTLNGPQAGTVAKGRSGNEAVVQPASGNAFTVNANNVTIDGFRIVGGSASAIDHTGYGVSGLKVLNNSVTAACGAHLFSCSDFQIEGNEMSGGQPVYLNSGFGGCANAVIKNNDIGPSDIGININCIPGCELDGLTVENNRLTGGQIALFAVKNASIKSNTVVAPAASSGIYVGGSCESVAIEGNTVSTDATVGNSCIRITTWYSLNKAITISDNHLSDASYGVKVTSGALASTSELTFSGSNTVAGNATADAIGLWLGGVDSGSALSLADMTFGAGLAEFIRLDAWTPDVNATSASFSGAPTDAAKEARVWHDVDDAALGHVDWNQGAAQTAALTVANVTGSVGDTVQLSAKLTAGTTALVGQSVAFSLEGTALGSATTDAAGVATVSHVVATGGTITARFSGVSPYKATTGTGTLTVQAAAPKTLTLTLAPTSVASGATTTCTVAGDNGLDYTGLCTYYVQYGAGGSWAGNVYTAGKAGTWTVTAIYNMLSATATLTVTPGAAATLSLTPATATINVGESQTYTVTATDAAGNTFTPPASCLSENGAGSFTAYAYTAAADDAGDPVTITATLAPAAPVTATLTVNAAAGTGNILAWDKDTRAFYLCSNATNPQAGTLLNVSGTYGAYTVAVTGGGTNVTVTTADGSSLRMYWYLRSGALYRCYQYSRIGGVTKTATFDGARTLVDGSWKTGFYGLTHTLSGAGVATYGAVKQ